MSRWFGLAAVFVFALPGLFAIPAVTLASHVNPASSELALFHATSTSSTNWGGYAVSSTSGAVTSVTGSWIVPKIVGTCPRANQYSSFWVGIDGFSSSTVEQIGTDSDCHHGKATYYAWYEFYPKASVLITGLTISPGHVISASVKYASGTFTTKITDVTTGKSFSTSGTVTGAQRSSAEWIAEAPSSSTGILPLADFGTVHFGFDSTNVTGTCDATISSTTAAFGTFSGLNSITMVSARHATNKAVPSAVSTDSTSFSVAWKSAGP